jgi:hypothetical protein
MSILPAIWSFSTRFTQARLQEQSLPDISRTALKLRIYDYGSSWFSSVARRVPHYLYFLIHRSSNDYTLITNAAEEVSLNHGSKCSVFWQITSRSLLKVNRRFGVTCLFLQCRRISKKLEWKQVTGGLFSSCSHLVSCDMLLRNVCWLSTDYIAPYLRRQNSPLPLPREPQILQTKNQSQIQLQV